MRTKEDFETIQRLLSQANTHVGGLANRCRALELALLRIGSGTNCTKWVLCSDVCGVYEMVNIARKALGLRDIPKKDLGLLRSVESVTDIIALVAKLPEYGFSEFKPFDPETYTGLFDTPEGIYHQLKGIEAGQYAGEIIFHYVDPEKIDPSNVPRRNIRLCRVEINMTAEGDLSIVPDSFTPFSYI